MAQQSNPVRNVMTRIGRWLLRQSPLPPTWLGGSWGHAGWWQTGLNSPLPVLNPLAFPAVYTSIDTISSDIARLPLRHFEMQGDRRIEIMNSAALRVLDEPNGYQSGFDMMKQFIASQLYRGNAYLYATRNRRYEIDHLHVINPDYVRPHRIGGEVFYEVGGSDELTNLEAMTMLTTRECLHHRIMTWPGDPLYGITPLVAAALSSSAGMAILRQTEAFFRQMSRPSGVLQTDGRLDPQRAEEIKARWRAVYGGEAGAAGEVAVLEQGLKFSPLTLSATDAQLIEQLRYTVEDVARVFRLPIFMLGDLSKVNYNSSEQLIRIYYAGCLAAHMDAIQGRLSLFFGMDNRREWLEFDLDELFRTEMAMRINALTKAIQGGLRTPNEARNVEGLNPVEGGDQCYVQQQMVPLSAAATRTDLAPKPPAPSPPQAVPQQRPPQPARQLDDEFDAKTIELRDALMSAVFTEPSAPNVVPLRRNATSQRTMIYGRRFRGAA